MECSRYTTYLNISTQLQLSASLRSPLHMVTRSMDARRDPPTRRKNSLFSPLLRAGKLNEWLFLRDDTSNRRDRCCSQRGEEGRRSILFSPRSWRVRMRHERGGEKGKLFAHQRRIYTERNIFALLRIVSSPQEFRAFDNSIKVTTPPTSTVQIDICSASRAANALTHIAV